MPPLISRSTIVIDGRTGAVGFWRKPHARMPPNREGLRPGGRVEAWKLLYVAMLYSGNHSALALGIAVAGSRPRLMAMMSEQARQLGLRDTHFNSTSGVIDDGITTGWATVARHTLAAGARRAKVRLIGVTLGSADAFTDLKRILDLGFRLHTT